MTPNEQAYSVEALIKREPCFIPISMINKHDLQAIKDMAAENERSKRALKMVLPLVKYLGEGEPNPEYDEMLGPKILDIQSAVEQALGGKDE